MAQLDIVDVGHAYAPGVEEERWALKPLNLTFESGKTYALVGPSGCGKTTLLNILSGLVRPSRGQVLFDGVDVTALPTKARNIAQVFQFPVIYRSMTVYENLAFPLQCRRWDRARIDAKVQQVAEALDLHGRLRQPARGLTADDKQLISLGRGLVRDDVAAVLMDEPLTVIDPQLKHLLRRKIREITEQFRPTVIYVTHDQYEAMSFAQEVLVMKDGRAVQQGTPEQLFEAPSSTYVGYFIGSPAMNFLTVHQGDGSLALGGRALSAAWDIPRDTTEVQVGVRPEYVKIVTDPGPNTFPGRLRGVTDHGAQRVLEVEVAGQLVRTKTPREDGVPAGEEVLVHLPRAKVLPYADGRLVLRS
ncbi:ABC transporter ATP-binding protein [Streptomyces sp. ISL-22]|uniref:ABC transporter ATP-binding protein n=1 Tax=unclassified Streptomyces TaxID=2593676 RepID=UPI001BE53942|nr:MULTISPECIES: ABC transporter ATP-binding protein [unclassified Streptomyces]MBT2424085.1 ABC transporter ATP-binding protein [Streptomyces sp. ISL-24]MBT2433809.1 ABC transporter ATP-binding protein [Streptomyces sp. ISL-22]